MKNSCVAVFMFFLCGQVLAASNQPDKVVIPFELAGRIIVVQAAVNGVEGNFLLDTGAPVIMLNRSVFAHDEIRTSPMNHPMPLGAGGAMTEVEASSELTLVWGGLTLTDQRALVADLSHLAENVGVPIVGLIGFEALEAFQVYFDYPAKELTLSRLGDDNLPVAAPVEIMPVQTIAMEMMGHIPYIPVILGGLELKLGIDSGAEGAVLQSRWQEELKDQYEFLRQAEMKGADTNVQTGDVVRFAGMKIGLIDYSDVTFQFNDIGGSGHQRTPFDGLLGYEFLSARPTALNFRARQVLIWPVKS